MTAPNKCTECGARIPGDAPACPDCGLPVETREPAGKSPEPTAAPEAPRTAAPRRPAASAAAGSSRTLQAGLIGAVVGAALAVGAMQMIKFLQPAQKAAAEETQADNGRMPAGEMPPGMPPGSAPALPEDVNSKIAMLKQMVDKSPDNFMHIVGLANLMYDAGKYKEAIPYYRKGLKLQPDSLSVQVDLATCMFQSGDGPSALAELDKVLRKQPHHGNAMYNRGVIEKSMGHQEQADKAWRDYVEHFPDGPKAAEIKAALASGETKKPGYKP